MKRFLLAASALIAIIAVVVLVWCIAGNNADRENDALNQYLDNTILEMPSPPFFQPLPAMVGYIGALAKVSIFIEPDMYSVMLVSDITVSLDTDRIQLRDALDTIAEQASLNVVIIDGAVLLTQKEKVKPIPPPPMLKDMQERLRNTRVSMSAMAKPVGDIIQSLSELTDVPIELKSDPEGEILEMILYDMSLYHALNWVARLSGLS